MVALRDPSASLKGLVAKLQAWDGTFENEDSSTWAVQHAIESDGFQYVVERCYERPPDHYHLMFALPDEATMRHVTDVQGTVEDAKNTFLEWATSVLMGLEPEPSSAYPPAQYCLPF